MQTLTCHRLPQNRFAYFGITPSSLYHMPIDAKTVRLDGPPLQSLTQRENRNEEEEKLTEAVPLIRQ